MKSSLKFKEIKKVPENHIFHEIEGELVETYWSKTRTAHFEVDIEKYDETTNKFVKIPKTHPLTSLPVMIGNRYEYLSELIVFSTHNSTAGKKEGDYSWCFKRVFEKTPEYIKKELEKLHRQGEIYTNEERMKILNPEGFEQYKEKQELKTENKAIKETNKALLARIAELEKQEPEKQEPKK